jgi:hypothetical protein
VLARIYALPHQKSGRQHHDAEHHDGQEKED